MKNPTQRKVIHIDMDAFYASVEQRDFPQYRNRPLVVGGQPDSRGVVAACSYEAREFGVHSAMPCSRAARLCPDAVFVKPRFESYRDVSRSIHKVFGRYTDLIEPLSLDEAYLDVTDCGQYQGSATLIAQSIKTEIKDELNLVASAGVSYNKFLAKIASDMDKPDGLYVIRPEQADTFIASLPIRKFFGVGKVTEQKMHNIGIRTGADLRSHSEADLIRHFGKAGTYYFNIARGNDHRAVKPNRERKSIGTETTFAEDLIDLSEIRNQLVALAEKVVQSTRTRELMAKTLTLKVKYQDFTQITRSVSHPASDQNYYDSVREISDRLEALIEKTELGQRPCRLLGLSLSNFQTTELSQPLRENNPNLDLWNQPSINTDIEPDNSDHGLV